MSKVATFLLRDLTLITVTYISIKNQYVALSHQKDNSNSIVLGSIKKMIFTETYGVIRMPYSGIVCSLIIGVIFLFKKIKQLFRNFWIFV